MKGNNEFRIKRKGSAFSLPLTPKMNAIEINKLSKRFEIETEKNVGILGRLLSFNKKAKIIHAFRDFSLDIEKGEALGIIGKNGVGKTTLLKLISGVYKPTSGKIKINGKMGSFIGLSIGFHYDLTVRDNIFLYAALRGMLREEIAKKFNEIIKFAELENFVDTKFKRLSSGMQARLAFATAIQTNPDILLLDEVLAVGDKEFYKKCLSVTENFKKSGKTILFVSHNLDAIKQFCTKVLYLRKDNSYEIGKPNDVINTYLKENK